MVLKELTPSKLNRTQGPQDQATLENFNFNSKSSKSSSFRNSSSGSALSYDEDLDKHRRNWLGATPLHLAARNGFVNRAQSLIAKGVDMNASTNQDYTPLHYAAMSGRTNMTRVLVSKGRELGRNDVINARNVNGWTPLHVACANGRTQTAILLIEMGAPIDAQDAQGRTPLDLVRKHKPSLTEVFGRQPAAVYVPSLENEDYYQYEAEDAVDMEKKKKKKKLKKKKGNGKGSKTQVFSDTNLEEVNAPSEWETVSAAESTMYGSSANSCSENKPFYPSSNSSTPYSTTASSTVDSAVSSSALVLLPATILEGEEEEEESTDYTTSVSSGCETAFSAGSSSFPSPPFRSDVLLHQHGEFPLSQSRVLVQNVRAGIARYELWERRKGLVYLLRVLQAAQRKYVS